MREYVITTDNTCDLPESYYQEHGIACMFLPCTLNGVTYDGEHQISSKEFYDQMRNGSMPTTSQVNSEGAKKLWIPILEEGKDVLHIAFSSGLSGTYNSCRLAAEELREEYPDARIEVIDSLCASMGEGLLLYKAVALKESGKTLDEVKNWLEENILHLGHVFTVDDLFHLHRGGRVSKVAAVLGTMINIKPMLHVDNEGHLILKGKVRGRKKALMSLISMMEERMGSYRDQNDIFMISHGDCEEDAQFVAEQIRKKYGVSNILIHPVGSTIGAHSGPGTVALFFMTEQR